MEGGAREQAKRSRLCAARTEDILGVPVEQIEVVVVEQLGRVEDALGRLRDVPPGPIRTLDGGPVQRVEHAQRRVLARAEQPLSVWRPC